MKFLMATLVIVTVFSVVYFQPKTNIEFWQPIHKYRYSKSDMVGENCSSCHSVDNNDIIVLVQHFSTNATDESDLYNQL